MSRRLEIELTSHRPDGVWTWRVAGARLPKGQVTDDLVPDGASVGTVLRAVAAATLDGLEITSLALPVAQAEPTDRLELIGTRRGPDVTTTLVPGRDKRRSHDDRDDDPRHGPRRRDKSRRSHRSRDDRGRRPSKKRRDQLDDRDARSRKSRGERRHARDSRRSTGRGRKHDGERGAYRGADRKQRVQRAAKKDHQKGSPSAGRSSAWPRTARLKAKRVHRGAVLESLPKDQLPLAREVLQGGVPGLRRTIKEMNKKASAEKLPQIKAEPLLALAETLAPRLKAAEWRDRADAVLADLEHVDLRDIRSVVVAADQAARTKETRALAEQLRSGLASRLESDHRGWLAELAATISEGRTVRALRLSSRPPKAGSPLPSDISERLSALASSDLAADAAQRRWETLLDAVSFSPIRGNVNPVGVPEKPSKELLAAVKKNAGRIPHIAALFGVQPKSSPRRVRPPSPPPKSLPADSPVAEDKAGKSEDAAKKSESSADKATADKSSAEVERPTA